MKEDTSVALDPLAVVCGDPHSKEANVVLKVKTRAILTQFQQLTAATAMDPGEFALKLLSIFYSDEELSESNCTFVEGRKLNDRNVLMGIKCKLCKAPIR